MSISYRQWWFIRHGDASGEDCHEMTLSILVNVGEPHAITLVVNLLGKLSETRAKLLMGLDILSEKYNTQPARKQYNRKKGFVLKFIFTNYLKEGCRWSSEEQFSFKLLQCPITWLVGRVVNFENQSIGSDFSIMFNPFTLRVSLESIVCYFRTFVNNSGIKQKLSKYLKESCRWTPVNISPSNISLKNVLLEKYIQNRQACFGRCEH